MSVGGIYESIAAGLGANGCMRPGGLALTQKALSRCSFLPGARVLDIGCGVGGTVEYLMEHHQLRALGIDPSLTILNHGHARNAALPLIAADGKALPFSDATWDGVFAECSLSLVKDSRRMLGECFRVLRNEGWLVLSDVYLRESGGGGSGASSALMLLSCRRHDARGIVGSHHCLRLSNGSLGRPLSCPEGVCCPTQSFFMAPPSSSSGCGRLRTREKR